MLGLFTDLVVEDGNPAEPMFAVEMVKRIEDIQASPPRLYTFFELLQGSFPPGGISLKP